MSNIKDTLVRCGAILYGDFTLSSGKKSKYYIDIKKASTDPLILEEVADEMALWQDDFTADQTDYFDLLCSLMEDYDTANVKWPKLRGADMLKHLLDEHKLTAADLSRLLGGSRNLGAMILRGERNLTLPHVRKLAAHFRVSPELFV